MATYLERSLAQLEEFEGSIPWMYLDTAGKVTVAVGLMLPDAAAAQRLPFRLADSAAGADAIAAEFARVDAMPMGRPALFYRKIGGPELAKKDIDSLLSAVVLGFEGELRAKFSAYDALPDGVKIALLDMAYNLGPDGLLRGYPKLIKAVETGDWVTAAVNCYRHGPGAVRNAWTKTMFLENVLPALRAAAESRWKQLGFGLLGATAMAVDWAKRKF